MSVSLPPDRLMAICKQRWGLYVLCWLGKIVALGWFFQQRAARPHGPIAPATLVAMGLAAALLALSDRIWRCPACKGRLPRGMLAPPPYCPLCAVLLSDPAEPRFAGSPTAKRLMWVVMGFLAFTAIGSRLLFPPRRHVLAGRGSGQVAEAITPPSPADREGLERQIGVVDHLLADGWPDARLRGSAADLVMLQRLLDSGRLKPNQTYELQCVGAAFGAVLANEAGLHWVIVEDGYGRDPALQYQSSSLIVFPLTMISKRVEQGERVELRRLFAALKTAIKQRGPRADPAPI